MCSPASLILTSIFTTLVSFQAILKMFSVINFNFNASKYIKSFFKTYKYVTILANVALAGEHIFQVLVQYS